MKYAIVLPDGAADEPVAELGRRTPLQAARTPNFDWIAANGTQGLLVTCPEGFTPGSDVCTLSVMGCDPRACYSGRAPLEAVARDVPMEPHDLVFRCNLVTIADGKMADFTAGHIEQTQAAKLIADLNERFSDDPVKFHEGVQYRHLMVLSDADDVACTCTPPHDIPDEPVAGKLPAGPGADRVCAIMDRAAAMLADHDVNIVRRDLGENPATHIWLWGQGRVKPLHKLTEQYGLRCACIAAVDLIRGITKSLGFEIISVPGATGFLDTDYRAKGVAAAAALDDFDLVCVHVEAPDEAGHMGSATEKVRAIKNVDSLVAGPLLEKLRSFDDWRILVAPDHPTPVRTRKHSAKPPPFCMAGTGIAPTGSAGFSESEAADCGSRVDPGYKLMAQFLSSKTA